MATTHLPSPRRRARGDLPQPLDRRALRARRPQRRRGRSPRTARSSSGPASTPAARRRTSSSSSEPSSEDKVWWGEINQPLVRGALRPPARAAHVATSPIGRSTARTSTSARIRTIGAALRVHTETAWASIFARNLFRTPAGRGPRGLRAELHDHRRPLVQGRPGHRGRAQRDGDPAPPRADGDHHRRDRVRRRDQEVGVHGDELPPPRRGAPCRCTRRSTSAATRRPRPLLRPLGHRQDDALRRSGAEPHRRRRAWLGRRWPLQLRGRLLRQDDPPVADVRAGHLRHHAPLRHDPRERRPRRGDPRARPRLASASPRTRGAPIRSSSSATPTRPA